MEWRYAARGGSSNTRFPWGDTITVSNANYRSGSDKPAYDESPWTGIHPSAYSDTGAPYTTPIGSFGPNGFGLYDVIGNLSEVVSDVWSSYAGGGGYADGADASSAAIAESRSIRGVRTARSIFPIGASAIRVDASVDTRDFVLQVESDLGTPIPARGGPHVYSWGTRLMGSVDAHVSTNGTNYSCGGWVRTGTVPLYGTRNAADFSVQGDTNTILRWHWIVDEDSDFLPDAWEELYFSGATNAMPHVDSDDDGDSNWREYILGGHPMNAGVNFEFTPVGVSQSGDPVVAFTTATGRVYTVECRTNLVAGEWTFVTNIIGSGDAFEFTDSPGTPQCFYRIRIDLEP